MKKVDPKGAGFRGKVCNDHFMNITRNTQVSKSAQSIGFCCVCFNSLHAACHHSIQVSVGNTELDKICRLFSLSMFIMVKFVQQQQKSQKRMEPQRFLIYNKCQYVLVCLHCPLSTPTLILIICRNTELNSTVLVPIESHLHRNRSRSVAHSS